MDIFPRIMVVGAADISPLFAVLSLMLIFAVMISLVLVRLKQNFLIGYMLCGILIANTGLFHLIGGEENGLKGVIPQLAELGVILLMFTLGVEFSLSELKQLWRVSLLGGSLQVGVVSFVAAGVIWASGKYPGAEILIIAVSVALSSTAVSMKSFQDLGQPNNPSARTALGIALFDDIVVILFLLLLPIIYGKGGSLVAGVSFAIMRGLLFLGGTFLLGKYVFTPLLDAVARTRSRELFTLAMVSLCAGVAVLGAGLGLSPALGAFAAGLVVSESIYRTRIMADIMPFKDLFLAVFFISVGLQIDIRMVAAYWVRIVGFSALIILVKGGVAFCVARIFKLPLRPALLTAAALSSSGEFSLVLLAKATDYRPADPATQQLLLSCAVLTMSLVPLLMRGSRPFGLFLSKHGVLSSSQKADPALVAAHAHHGIRSLMDHAVICGYGPVGRALNEALIRSGVETLVLELNVETIKLLQKQGQRVLFADATHPEAIELANIERARLVAFTFPSSELTRAAVPLVRQHNPEVMILGRVKFEQDGEALRELGISVIHDERESAVAMIHAAKEIFQRIHLSESEIRQIADPS